MEMRGLRSMCRVTCMDLLEKEEVQRKTGVCMRVDWLSRAGSLATVWACGENRRIILDPLQDVRPMGRQWMVRMDKQYEKSATCKNDVCGARMEINGEQLWMFYCVKAWTALMKSSHACHLINSGMGNGVGSTKVNLHLCSLNLWLSSHHCRWPDFFFSFSFLHLAYSPSP